MSPVVTLNLYRDGVAKPPTDEACERDEQQMLRPTLELPTVTAPTCPSCQSHNVTDGHCGDCNLTDAPSAFTGGGMTTNACFTPSRFGKSGGKGRTFDRSAPRGWTISGRVD